MLTEESCWQNACAPPPPKERGRALLQEPHPGVYSVSIAYTTVNVQPIQVEILYKGNL